MSDTRWLKKLDKFIARQKVSVGFVLSRDQAMDLLISRYLAVEKVQSEGSGDEAE